MTFFVQHPEALAPVTLNAFDTEADAERYAAQLVREGARYVTVFEADTEEDA